MRVYILLFILAAVTVILLRRRRRSSQSEADTVPVAGTLLKITALSNVTSRDLTELSSLINDLDLVMMRIRRHMYTLGAFMIGDLDFGLVVAIEKKLACKLDGRPNYDKAPLEIKVDNLEAEVADCLIICALIENKLAKPALSAQFDRPLIVDAKNDLEQANLLLETASLLLRAVPAEQRFSRVRFVR